MADYDLIIAGAGIQGAGVAQAGAACGWRVLVVEKHAEAGLETSSNSSKLIHGGLRYLETGQIALVRECLRERQLLLRNAPELVRLSLFYLPVYRHSTRAAWKIGLGLTLYDLLSGKQGQSSFKVPKRDWSQLPVRQQDLVAVFAYFDGQTDDRALTQAVLRSAMSLGAEVRLQTSVTEVRGGSSLQVHLSQGEPVTARAFVNAAGASANQLAARVEGAPLMKFDWVQGIHVLLDVPAFSGCFYLEAPADGRAVFVLPWRGKTLVGTTERVLPSPVAEVSHAEVDYLLQVFNHYFSDQACSRANIVQTFAGIRVLPKTAKDANRRSRETVFAEQRLGEGVYLAICGGKLTSYRATAAKVVARLERFLGTAGSGRIDTTTLTLEP